MRLRPIRRSPFTFEMGALERAPQLTGGPDMAPRPPTLGAARETRAAPRSRGAPRIASDRMQCGAYRSLEAHESVRDRLRKIKGSSRVKYAASAGSPGLY